MPDRWGRPTGGDWASMGAIASGMMRDQRQDAIRSEKQQWDREDRNQDRQADEVTALLNDQGEKADLTNFDPISRAKGVARYAEIKTAQQRNSAEGIRLEKEKMGMSLQRIQNLGREYLSARGMGDNKAAEQAALNFIHHARNGVREVKDLGNGKVAIRHMDGSMYEIQKPTPEQMDATIQGYLADPNIHIQNRLNEKREISGHNAKAAQNPQLWENDKGQQIIARIGFIDPGTRQSMSQYEDAKTMQPLSEEQVKAGGFRPLKVAQDEANFAKAAFEKDKAQHRRAIGAGPMPTAGATQDGGYGAENAYGTVTKVPAEQATPYLPKKETPKPGQETIPVKTADGKTINLTRDQILKEAAALSNGPLANAKTKNGTTINYNPEVILNAGPEEQKTALGRILEISRDLKGQSQEVRSAAKQFLRYYKALGIMQTDEQASGGKRVGGAGKGESWRNWMQSNETPGSNKTQIIGQ